MTLFMLVMALWMQERFGLAVRFNINLGHVMQGGIGRRFDV